MRTLSNAMNRMHPLRLETGRSPIRLRPLALLAGLLLLAACAAPEPEPEGSGLRPEDRQVLEENVDLLYGLMSIERYSPPRAARLFAYAYLALYEGWAPELPELQSLAGRLNGLDALPRPAPDEELDGLTAGLTAQHEVIEHLLEGAQPFSLHEVESFRDRHVARRLDEGVPSEVIERSAAFGRELAGAIIQWADADRYRERWELADYAPGRTPGSWVPTADYGMSVSLNQVTNMVQLFEEDDWRRIREGEQLGEEWLSDRMLLTARPQTITNQNVAMEPGWRHLRTFVLDSARQVPAPDPAPYSEEPDSPFYREAMAVYESSREMNPEHFATGHYWADLPAETGTPAGHWIKISIMAATQNDVPFARALQATTLTALAFADAFIVCWETKYTTDVIRPVTYIRAHIDPDWVPFIVTPPFPEYTSGHAVQSFAAAQTLTALLGEIPFVDHTLSQRYGFEPRRYPSFLDAAEEASLSRLYGGIHYPMGIEHGNEQGRQIGRLVVERLAP